MANDKQTSNDGHNSMLLAPTTLIFCMRGIFDMQNSSLIDTDFHMTTQIARNVLRAVRKPSEFIDSALI